MAPHSIAFLPKVFPAKASPIQAPMARWVIESIPVLAIGNYQISTPVYLLLLQE
jgi:hypothetical protein